MSLFKTRNSFYMNAFKIDGSCRLKGELIPQGAKNEALQIISAVLLTEDKIVLDNVPEILDVMRLIELLETIGVKVERLGYGKFEFHADEIRVENMLRSDFKDKSSKLRGSIMLLGPILSRFGKCYIARPGGDKIGRRRLDTHFMGMKSLGANFDFEGGVFTFTTNGLKGNYMLLDEASVTGTANIIMAGVLAEGTTTIFNAACEPYISQLCRMLVSMGANIDGIGSNLLTIKGVGSLHGCEHRMLPDMIEIGSFIGLAAMTMSNITIKDANKAELGIIPQVFRRLGIKIDEHGNDLHIPEQEHYMVESFIDGSIMTISDAPWPGFTPDLISIALVTAIQAKGTVLIHQKMFESRLFFVDKLIDMGAQIILCDPHRATVIGLDRSQQLKGVKMASPDIRAGVSLLIAALSAKGTSIIENIDQIDRGYIKIDERLNAIGAKIQRI